MDVSVIICTRNRATSLAKTLESLSALTVPRSCVWEVVIVDNGSTDATPAAVARLASRLPIRSVIEPEPGLSQARNTGVATAGGQYFLWTDDDVLVDPGWLTSYLRAFQRYPEACVFGGKIHADLEAPVPDWFRDNRSALGYLLAERDFGPSVQPLSPEADVMPFGANYAVRAQEQRSNLYDPNLGVAPGRMRLGEETTVITEILRSGSGFWLPDAVVKHQISRERQTMEYVMRYYGAHGNTMAFKGFYADVPTLFGAPRFLWKRSALRWLAYHHSRWTKPSAVWIEQLKLYAQDRGALEFYL